jgi:CheY-like chemotaxis protein
LEVVPEIKICPHCGWSNVRPSSRRGLLDSVLAIMFLTPFRCRNCRHRFFRFSVPGETKAVAGPPAPAARPVKVERPAISILPPPVAVKEIAKEQTVVPAAAPSILVADSDPSIRKLLRRVLERQGYAVHELPTPDNIASELRVNPVDLLITDLGLPRQEAAEAVPVLRAEYPNLKIILLSGYLSSDTRQSNQIHGALAVLPKPFPTELLLESVRTALMGRVALPLASTQSR